MRFKALSQRGDTIIEVLLAMSVVGLVLGSSFGIANRSLRIGQAAKERTTALKIAESQIELMKSLKGTPEFVGLSTDFCITPNPPFSIVKVTDSSLTNPLGNECVNINENGEEGFYTIRVSPPGLSGASSYAVNITWTRIGASSLVDGADQDSLTLYYKVGIL